VSSQSTGAGSNDETIEQSDMNKWRATGRASNYHIHHRCKTAQQSGNLVEASESFIEFHDLSLCENCAHFHPDNEIHINRGSRGLRVPKETGEWFDTVYEMSDAPSKSELIRCVIPRFAEWVSTVDPAALIHVDQKKSQQKLSVAVDDEMAGDIKQCLGPKRYATVGAVIRAAITWFRHETRKGRSPGDVVALAEES